ncbi:MAG: ABC transporter ATP-binding protein [Chloroflexi bacterium]|nr:ABC transporter ATP-binding protein [Chloroflexota bacterium]
MAVTNTNGTSRPHAVVVEDLTKRYGERTVVDHLSFTVEAGEVFALLGPNGAGKTTTIEVLEGYRHADGGTARVLGLDPRRESDRLKRRIGLMLQQGGIYPTTRPLEVLRLYGAFFEHPLDPRELLERFGLEVVANTPYRRLSGGQKQRLSLALALVGRPELVFLDEPTAAMDPQARAATWGAIRALKEEGVTVLLTTHFMDEAERLSDRVAIIDHGRLVALDRPERLTSSGRDAVRFRAEPGLPVGQLAAWLEARDVREDRPGHYIVSARATPALLAHLTAWLEQREVLIGELRVARRSLEEVFLDLTGRELRD